MQTVSISRHDDNLGDALVALDIACRDRVCGMASTEAFAWLRAIDGAATAAEDMGADAVFALASQIKAGAL